MTSPLLNPGQLWLGVVRGSDEEAFESLLSTMLKPGIDPASFIHGEVIQDPTDPTKVTTQVSVLRAKANIALWAYTDQLSISYKRIKLDDISNYFGETVRVDLPTTVREMMSVYFNINQLHDRSDQVLDATVEDVGVVEVSAIPGLAFIEGTAQFTVKPFQRYLEDVILVTTISGFRSPADMVVNSATTIVNQASDANPDLRYPLELELTALGQPTNISGYAHDNTKIVMTATGEGFYKGSVELVYTRHDFGWSLGGSQPYVEGPSQPTTQFMIARVSQLTGFPITLDDVVIDNYASIAPGNLETLTVNFNPNSLRYTGSLTIDYRAV
ncbi:hypothetical protein D3C85_16240 [compost metagenome]